MQVHAFLGTDPVITVGSNDLRWKTVQVVFAGGTVESAAAEHGLTAELKQGTTVSIGGLSGSGATYPSGLAMTVTFTSDTNMDDVRIDFTSPDTTIVTDVSSPYPPVAFASLAPNGRVATIVQDDKNEMYAFAPGVEINTIEIENDMATLNITTLLDGLSVIPSAYFFGLAYLDGSGTAIAQEVPIAACTEALDPTIGGQVTFVSIKSDESPPPEFDLLIIVVGAFFFDPCETCAFPLVSGSTIEPEVCVPNAAGDACVTESDGATTCYVSAPGCSCDGGDAACWKLAILGGPQHATTASCATGSRAALHAHQQEPWTCAACSQRPGCRHEPGPTSLILFSLPNSATAPFPIDPSVCADVGGECKAFATFPCTSGGAPCVSPVKAGATMSA